MMAVVVSIATAAHWQQAVGAIPRAIAPANTRCSTSVGAAAGVAGYREPL